ncbi:circularly permutated Ras protein 1 [Pelomyxa schiedti]|nr:circularly permutated Ras protein 1 [Pelomyxa schiedti]
MFTFGSKKAYRSATATQASPSLDYDLLFKLLLLGDSKCGKSCFLVRFCDDTFFSETFISTIGIDFKSRSLQVGDRVVKLQIWDTAGQERFRSITSSYYRGASGIFLCYSIDDRATFDHACTQFLHEVQARSGSESRAMLLGLKSDLTEDRAVPQREARAFAEAHNMLFAECSAKTGANVTDAVVSLVRVLCDAKASPVVLDVRKEVRLHDDETEMFQTEDLDASLRQLQATQSAPPPRTGAYRAMKTDVNVFKLNLATLASEASVITGDPVLCKRCGTMMSSISKISRLSPSEAQAITLSTALGPNFTPAPPIHPRLEKKSWVNDIILTTPESNTTSTSTSAAAPPVDDTVKTSYWCCDFCAAPNMVDADAVNELAQNSCVEYLIEPPRPVSTASSNIVFVVDVSGSMCVTSEIEGVNNIKGSEARRNKARDFTTGFHEYGSQYLPRERRGVTHVSRLQCLQAAIEAQIKRLAQERPDSRVGIIAFSNEVRVFGDCGSSEQVVAGDRLCSWAELNSVSSGGGVFALGRSVKEAEADLLKKLWELEESGATALGPALILGVNIAGTAPGSQVIVCTDGLANQGLGTLEGNEQEMVAFYTEVGEQATLKGVVVSVLSLTGDGCRLETLSSVTEKTSGTIDRVDPRSLTGELNAIVGAPSSIAYGAMAMVLIHRSLRFRGEMDDENEQRFWLVRDLGNVTTASECTFSYSFRPKTQVATAVSAQPATGITPPTQDTPISAVKSETTSTSSSDTISTTTPADTPPVTTSTTTPADIPPATTSTQTTPETLVQPASTNAEPTPSEGSQGVSSTATTSATQKPDTAAAPPVTSGDAVNAPAEVPFQVQLLYTKPNGAIFLRVTTEKVAVTESRQEAEHQADATVIGDHFRHHAAKLAKQGHYEEAQLETRAAQRYMYRVHGPTIGRNFSEQAAQLDAVVNVERYRTPSASTTTPLSDPTATPSPIPSPSASQPALRIRQQTRSDAAAAAISNATSNKRL